MIALKDIRDHIHSVLEGGDILFIVPPFTTAKNPVLGVHILSEAATDMGFKSEILYLNVLLAGVIGLENAEYACYPPFERMWMMLHERLFARSAYDLPPLGKYPEYCDDMPMCVAGTRDYPDLILKTGELDLEKFFKLEEVCTDFVDETAAALAELEYRMIGCTTRMGQTNCSVALLDRIKRHRPDIITIIGGSDCKGVQAKGVASLTNAIDYVFLGESDLSFPEFLKEWRKGELPTERIITGPIETDLNRLPLPDYACYMDQADRFLGKDSPEKTVVCYESSRGCWWGEKNRCRFCSEDQVCRQKSSEKVLADLKQLGEHPRIQGVYMCDVAMPLSYQEEVFPSVIEDGGYPHMYFQAKVNIKLEDIVNLKKANVTQFTFGIESLSSGLLKSMNKGTLARHNLRLLRYARSTGILVDWLMLWGFPMDKESDYLDTLELLPLISHFQPPATCLHLFLAKWSPYFERPEEFHIQNVRPMNVYNHIFPEHADLDSLASWYVADYPSAAYDNPELMRKIGGQIKLWQAHWQQTYLAIMPMGETYMVLDNRECNGKKQHLLGGQKAKEIMTGGKYTGSENQVWALQEKLGVLMDSWYVPLITGDPGLLMAFEQDNTGPLMKGGGNNIQNVVSENWKGKKLVID